MTAAGYRLGVLGSPIAHSKSPALHLAAYRVLGLDWTYTAVETTEATLTAVVEGSSWHGLSLTMPLKQAVRPLLAEEDLIARTTGAVNTVLVDRSGAAPVLRGFNTDVAGIVRALGEEGVVSAERVEILGAGATAASALAAAAELGATHAVVTARTPAKAAALAPVAAALGLVLEVRSFAEWGAGEPAPLVISTLPGGATDGRDVPDAVVAASTLFDVAYSPWPSALARRWGAIGSPVVSGLGMLLHQALVQVRIFVGGDPGVPLAREDEVLSAMRRAVSAAPLD
ncbi:shikimate dehydrogenase family protein [Rathayibacter iranicus]|uniref:shikimate dehydrogenase family protein n=1 Tax=Rathayibacter iranicus TaxID=59737 RepID=UPI000CE8FAFC|nr:shikimate dehydrogenase [Rathayibacter iranicus]PPI50120.1 shikimate dehydrogenase [Rathayibacter iranicus]PPI73599.1 shikimate dehydrogenase [Rathayibacter iranicus]